MCDTDRRYCVDLSTFRMVRIGSLFSPLLFRLEGQYRNPGRYGREEDYRITQQVSLIICQNENTQELTAVL